MILKSSSQFLSFHSLFYSSAKMEKKTGKRTLDDFQMKRGRNVYKKTALGTQRGESRMEDQCPFLTAVNDEIRRLGNEYLSDVKTHLEYYPNVQRASIHLMKIAGLSAGSRLSFDVENLPMLMMVFATAYSKIGMNEKTFGEAVELSQKLLTEMKELKEREEME